MGSRPFVRRLGLRTLLVVLLTTSLVAPAAAHGCRTATTTDHLTATETTTLATATGTTSCSTVETISETRSTESDETTATARTAHTVDTQRAENGDAHETILWKLTTIQFLSGTSMVLAGGALWAAVLAYRGTD